MLESISRHPDLMILRDQLYFILDRLVYDKLPVKIERMMPDRSSHVSVDLTIRITSIEKNGKRLKALQVTVYLDLGLKSTIQYRQSLTNPSQQVITYEHSAIKDNQHSAKFNVVIAELNRELRKYGMRAENIDIHPVLVRNDDQTHATRLSQREAISSDTDPSTLPNKSKVLFNHLVSVYYVPDKTTAR